MNVDALRMLFRRVESPWVLLASLVLVLPFFPSTASAACTGDCDGSGDVTVNEIVTMVNIALGNAPLSTCTAGDADGSGDITVDEIIAAVPKALSGCGGSAFVDNGDGTITDLRTGLMWEKKSDDGSIHDQDKRYTWGEALNTFIPALNSGGGFAGRTDWRLPTSAGNPSAGQGTGQAAELESLLAMPYPCNVDPCVHEEFNTNCVPGCTETACSCTQSSSYWSASTFAPANATWSVYFNDGRLDFAPSFLPIIEYVRAVRGGS